LFTSNLLKVLRKEKTVKIAKKNEQTPCYFSTGKGNCLGIRFDSYERWKR
jgi:hypothetical protein